MFQNFWTFWYLKTDSIEQFKIVCTPAYLPTYLPTYLPLALIREVIPGGKNSFVSALVGRPTMCRLPTPAIWPNKQLSFSLLLIMSQMPSISVLKLEHMTAVHVNTSIHWAHPYSPFRPISLHRHHWSLPWGQATLGMFLLWQDLYGIIFLLCMLYGPEHLPGTHKDRVPARFEPVCVFSIQRKLKCHSFLLWTLGINTCSGWYLSLTHRVVEAGWNLRSSKKEGGEV